ncbi:Vacuolar protein sorting-associated protein 33B [Taenia crassiceps]|uniref:Vacuolar protein sorting-associated protein 33B n=1 Tax=Taenia crassiceps TaxID=6207 RepID=A0ABR4QCC4_9CEST
MNIPLESLKANTLANIEVFLKKLPGEKHMLIESTLLRAMDRVVSMRVLSSLGVKKVFKIQELPPEASLSRLVYIITPTKKAVQTIIEHTEVDRRAQIKRCRLVAFVPKQTAAVKTLLESRGVLGNDLQIADLSFGWIPIDVDLISLNLPEVYTNYFLHGDTSWPYHFGQMLGHVLEAVLHASQAPTDINLHAFGSAAQVSAAGFSSAICQIGASKLASSEVTIASDDRDSPSLTPHHQPLFILFSRNLDYITPFMVPTTFEALIHEVIGIDNGVVELPNVQNGDIVPAKVNLSSSNINCFKDVRNAHISTVHKWLQAQRSMLEDSRTGLGFSLAALDRSMPNPGEGPLIPTVASLTNLSSQLKPILSLRKELTALFICLEEVMRKMANEERVEDLLAAQTEILQSGSGGALAMPVTSLSSSTASTGSASSSQQETYEPMPPEAATGTCADDPTCQPVRLALEWLSTRFGDHLTEAVRLLCLLSVTHDGLGEELYGQVVRHIQHAVGFSIYPVLVALRRLRLLCSRRPRDATMTSAQSNVERVGTAMEASSSRPTLRLVLAPTNAEKLASATERLIKRRKSTYNYLHRLLQLSMRSQASLGVDKPAVSPSYVFGGQHVPVVVRLAESLWADGLTSAANTGRPLLNGTELLKRDQLSRALTLLHIDERVAKSLGRVSLVPTTTGAGEGGWKTLSHGQTVVVAFVGGCTYAEVAALRFAAARRCWRLLIATSQILSTKSLIHQVGQAAAL